MDQSELVDVFLQRVTQRAYSASLTDIDGLLTKGPIGREPNPDDIQLHEWYKSLDTKSRQMIEIIMKRTAYHVLFGLLVLLDNQTMGYPIEGTRSDFALYVQSYADAASHAANDPIESVRLNDPRSSFDLHDLISKYLD